MTREQVVSKYQQLHEQAEEKSAQWYVFGQAFGLMEHGANLVWVVEELRKSQRVIQEAGASHGYLHDGEYGTYCAAKSHLYDQVIDEILSIQEKKDDTQKAS